MPQPSVLPTATIYELVDPRTQETRYVGQTIQPLPIRLGKHLTSKKTKTHVYAWIRLLEAEGLKPVIREIVQVPGEHADTVECFLISYYRTIGARLTNHESGGRTNKTFSQVHREKISAALKGRPSPLKGRSQPEEVKQKRAAAMVGKTHTPEAKAKMSTDRRGKPGRPTDQETKERIAAHHTGRPHPHKGAPRSEETKEKIAVTKRGRKMPPRTEEHQAKLSTARTGKPLSEEHRANISAAKRKKVQP